VQQSSLLSIQSYNASDELTFHAEYSYDSEIRATRSVHGLSDHSYDTTVGNYEDLHDTNPHTVTNINNLTTSFTFNISSNGPHLTNVSGAAQGSCVASNASYSYGPFGYVILVTAESGLQTDYDFYYNKFDFGTIGLPDTVTYKNVDEGADRVIDYEWTANRQLEKLTHPGLIVDYTYEYGRLATLTETDTTLDPPDYDRLHPTTRGWTYDYTYYGNDADGLHRIKEVLVTGPRGANDTTTYTYSPIGDLTNITDALDHSVTFADHNTFGLPETMVDNNNVTTTLGYDGRGHLNSVTTSGATTEFTYNPESNVTRIDFPDERYLEFTYSDSGRLLQITNQSGDRVEKSGFSHIVTKTFDVDDVQHGEMWRSYDALGRFWKMYDLGGVTGDVLQEVAYDAVGNPDTIIDGNNGVIEQVFDALGRLETVTDKRREPTGVATDFWYNKQDRLVAVTDADNITTTYHYDGFGNLLRTSSPDTGTTDYQYDEAGNVRFVTNAANIAIEYTYDLLNRLESIDYPNQADVTLVYDEKLTNGIANYGVGRLTTMSTSDGDETHWIYDAKGRVVRDIRKIGATTYITRYGYHSTDKLTSMTYPSGHSYTIGYLNGILRSITLDSPATTILDNITFEPFGPLADFTFGNDSTYSMTPDLLYRMDDLQSGSDIHLVFDYDALSFVDHIDDLGADNIRSADFTYLPDGGLWTASGEFGNQTFEYSNSNDRLSTDYDLNDAAVSDTYYYLLDTHLLQKVESTNIDLPVGETAFNYNDDGRITSVTVNWSTIATYTYNPLNQRQSKTVESETRHFIYDLDGKLIWEGLADGSWQRDYLYLNSLLVAFVDSSGSTTNVYYVHTDHLGTPQIVSNAANVNVWAAHYTPFGQTDITLATIENNIRFPGQYYDEETGLHYNWHRYYDPSTGRYITADPIGLAGGINLYSYVQNNPVNFVDPLGLWTVSVGVNIGAMFGAVGGGGGTAINIGYSATEGLSASLTGTVGGGAVTGIGAGVGVTLAATNAASVEQLLGTSVEASRGLGPVAATGIAGNGYTGGALSIGLGGKTISPSKGAGIVTSTSAIAQWEQNSGFSFLQDGSGCK
jgi:RHS repeat-associated protein